MSEPKTANQYLASIGLGPVNLVCPKCKQEVARLWTDAQICTDCILNPKPEYPAVVHIRNQPSRFGRPGYSKRHYMRLGVSDAAGRTLCGAEPTLYDIAYRDRKTIDRPGNVAFRAERSMAVCQECLRSASRA